MSTAASTSSHPLAGGLRAALVVGHLGRAWEVTLYPETKPWPILGCRLRPLDVAFLRAVHEKVNIIPVIGKADALMPSETQALKQKVGVVNSGLWPHMKPKVMIKPELSFF